MKQKIKKYLDRIGFSDEPKLDYTTLCQIQEKHLKTVPYENLDIMRNIPLSLEPEDIYEKIVVRGRGGYCFELNGLYTWLLRGLGFEVTEFMARFLRDEKEIPMRRHRVLKVICEGKAYLCDVGVGQVIPRRPIELITDRINEFGNEKYKLKKEPFFGYVLYEQKSDSWRRVYSFTEEEQLNIDYVMPSFYCEAHPESYFRTMDMVHIFTDNGRKSIAANATGSGYGHELKIFSPTGVEVIEPLSDEHYHELLETHFGIRL